MKIYLQDTVWERSLKRIRYIFDEFPNVVCNISGGKDSTLVFNLTMKVAEEKGRLPLKVFFIDQEAEWVSVIDHVRAVMRDPRVEPYWMQCPIRLFNATSPINPWLHCWNEDEKEIWMRDREPDSIHENIFNNDRFHPMFKAFITTMWPDTKSCYIAGVRAEESKGRTMALTNGKMYKHITWGKILDKRREHFTFYPVYDWSYRDVWKAIQDNAWPYARVYDQMYQYGIPVLKMRVSNLHHETAVHSLFYLQEIEPDTWDKLVQRLGGIHTAGILGKDDYFYYGNLPYMFEGWKEYRDYLLDNLVLDKDLHKIYRNHFRRIESLYERGRFKNSVTPDGIYKACIQAILANDHEFIKLDNFSTANRKPRRMREREAQMRKEQDEARTEKAA